MTGCALAFSFKNISNKNKAFKPKTL